MELLNVWLILTSSGIFASARFIDVSAAAVNLVSCACNTQECRSQGTNRCMATNMCYVQYVPAPPTRRNRPNNAQRPKKDNYIRGCINRSTPLLCENRPPALMGQLQAEWPVLHCCSSDMCNKNVLPTPPVWMPTTTRGSIQDIYKSAEAVQQLEGQIFRSGAAASSATGSLTPPRSSASQSRGAGEMDPAESDDNTTDEDILIASTNTDSGDGNNSPAADPEVPLDTDSPTSEVILNRMPISPHSDEENDEVTRILTPNLPAVVESASNDLHNLKIFYIGAPLVGVILVVLLVLVAVMACRRNQFVSTESLVHNQKAFLPYHQHHHSVMPSYHENTLTAASLQSLPGKKSSNGGSQKPKKNFKGHDHVSYISGSSLDDQFPEVFNGHTPYDPYYSSPTH